VTSSPASRPRGAFSSFAAIALDESCHARDDEMRRSWTAGLTAGGPHGGSGWGPMEGLTAGGLLGNAAEISARAVAAS